MVDRYASVPYRLTNLATIEAPTVIVQWAADPLASVAAAEEIAARVPGAELRLIPGLGHDIPAELVSTFVDAIIAAVDRATGMASVVIAGN